MSDQTITGRVDVTLAGTITAQGTANGIVVTAPYLSGTITSHFRIWGRFPPYLIGRITAQGRIRGRFPPYLIGRITATSSARNYPPVFSMPGIELRLLSGHIQSNSWSQARPPLFHTNVSGRIQIRSSAWVVPPLFPVARPAFMVGGIKAAAR